MLLNPVLEFSTAWVINAVLVLARVSGIVAFVPIPGLRQFPAQAKIILALALTVLFMPFAWGRADAAFLHTSGAVWTLAGWVATEAVFGLAVGVGVALLLEAFGLAAQVLGFQAGYSYVNMVDPTTQVDASILNVLLTVLGSLLFFAFDLHLFVIVALVESFNRWPLGSFSTSPLDGIAMVHLGGLVFQTAVRLALPVIAVLLLIDLTLGLLNQINSRLQLLTLAFPTKIVAALALLYPVTLVAPRLFHDLAVEAQRVISLIIER